MRDRVDARTILRRPLVRAGRALRQFPLVAEQVPEEVVAPLRRRGGPGDFHAARDRVAALARAEAVLLAQALVFEVARFGLASHVPRVAGAMGLAEGMASSDQRDGLLVVHGHAGGG